jgi:hypothetical protein
MVAQLVTPTFPTTKSAILPYYYLFFLKNGAICSFFHKFVVGEIVSCDSVHFVPKKLNQKSQKTIQPWEKR